MGTDESSAVVPFVLGLAVGMLFAVFAGALMLKLSMRMIEKFSPSYLRCCLAMLVSTLASFALNAVIWFAAAFAVNSASQAAADLGRIALLQFLALGLGTVVAFVVNALAIRKLIRRPDGSALDFGRACLVGLLQMVFLFVLYCLLLLVLVVVAGALLPYASFLHH
ncbi:hypothetical protein [Arenimonas sp.]|uniref:hypothetical protein n=1 Tax=Arenimonas sp. TaxID=1872635 RepID=UPI0039E369E3